MKKLTAMMCCFALSASLSLSSFAAGSMTQTNRINVVLAGDEQEQQTIYEALGRILGIENPSEDTIKFVFYAMDSDEYGNAKVSSNRDEVQAVVAPWQEVEPKEDGEITAGMAMETLIKAMRDTTIEDPDEKETVLKDEVKNLFSALRIKSEAIPYNKDTTNMVNPHDYDYPKANFTLGIQDGEGNMIPLTAELVKQIEETIGRISFKVESEDLKDIDEEDAMLTEIPYFWNVDYDETSGEEEEYPITIRFFKAQDEEGNLATKENPVTTIVDDEDEEDPEEIVYDGDSVEFKAHVGSKCIVTTKNKQK